MLMLNVIGVMLEIILVSEKKIIEINFLKNERSLSYLLLFNIILFRGNVVNASTRST